MQQQKRTFGIRHFATLLLSTLILLVSSNSQASSIELSLTADKSEVGLDDYLTIKVSITGNSISSSPDVTVEGLEEFEVVGKSSSSHISIVNMDFKKTSSTTYTLVPKSSGKTVTLKASASSGGKTFFSAPLQVKLVKSSAKNHPPSSQQQRRRGGPFGGIFDHDIFQSQRNFKKDDFMLQADVSNPQAYVGQEITYTIAFYQGYQIRDGASFNFPESKGFWKEELPEATRINTKDITLAGRPYRVSEISRLIYPLTDGKFTLGKGNISFQVNAFSPGMRLESNSIEVEVLPLPDEGKPENFSGLVGDYSIKTEISDATPKTGKPITLKVIVTGSGNLYAIPKPDEPTFKFFEKYEPETIDSFKRTAKGSSGSRTFKYIVVPNKEGEIEIGSFETNFFNPKTGSYSILKTEPIKISANNGNNGETPYGKAAIERKADNADDKRLRPIKLSAENLKDKGAAYYSRGIFWGYILLLLSILFGGTKYLRKREAERLAKINGANLTPIGKAKERLKNAEKFLTNGDADRFYMETDRAIRPYAAFKLGIEKSSLEKLKLEITSNSSKAFALVVEIIEQCETVRFGPVIASKEEMETLLEKAKKALADMENQP